MASETTSLAGERRREVVEAVRAVLLEAEEEIGRRGEAGGAVCKASGRCCKFEEWGHRLYVTGVEAVYFEDQALRRKGTEALRGEMRNAECGMRNGEDAGRAGLESGRRVSLRQFFAGDEVAGCPYQVEGLCTAREARPLGCRVYFCDERAKGWLEEVYEKYHAKLKAVHERLGVPYEYLEWREALRRMMAEGEIGNQKAEIRKQKAKAQR